MDTSLLLQLTEHPEQALNHFDLVYVTEDKMPIIRSKNIDDFEYFYANEPLGCNAVLKRIESLVIPPAWENVKITHLSNGHLQATGRDSKRRKQYRYHPQWTQVRKQTKFYRMASFGSTLPLIREKVDVDLESPEWGKSKVLALVVRLMEETHIRIGSEQYAKRNKTYGLSTLRKRHVDVNRDRLKFNFKGKRGKKHSVTLRNKKLIRLVAQCEEIPGWELFHYYDYKGDKQEIDSGMVNDYLKSISGKAFTAKDFRTWAAGVIFFNSLMDMTRAKNAKTIKKNILKAYDATAEALGNTRNVCRRSYVHPVLPTAYEEGRLQYYFEKVQKSETTARNFSPSEIAVLELISNYEPEI